MCIGLGVRLSDVDLGPYHKSLSVKFSPSVLGCFLLEEAGEGRFVSNEWDKVKAKCFDFI